MSKVPDRRDLLAKRRKYTDILMSLMQGMDATSKVTNMRQLCGAALEIFGNNQVRRFPASVSTGAGLLVWFEHRDNAPAAKACLRLRMCEGES